jgi:protein-tyrosine phosphatase
MAPDRVIAVPGTSNFRDFGGCPAGSGATVVAGRLFRSAHLGNVGAAGAERLAALGIATIIDLRGTAERATAPATFAAERRIRIVATPIEPASSPRIQALVAEGRAGAEEIRAIMIDSYRRFAGEAAPRFGRALAALADACDAPLVIHCTAGKDRTGFLVAIVQALLGVPRATIFAGYEATNHAWDRALAAGLPLDPAASEALLAADPAYLETAFATIAARHGSVADFVAAALGSDARAVDRLTERLLGKGDVAMVMREAQVRAQTLMPR